LIVTMASRTTALFIRRACVLSRNIHLAPSSQSTKVIALRNGLPQTLISSFHTTGPAGNFDYENDSDETLESLCEKFEAILDSRADEQSDVTLASGVLTLSLEGHGTYVINKQSPNRQIWLSSPISGPSRFDYNQETNTWVYKHTGSSLHTLLEEEIGGTILKEDLGLRDCHLGGGDI